MPSKRRPTKRKKRKTPKLWSPPRDWRPWLWGALAANVLVGLYASPATAVRSLRFEGVPKEDQERLAQLARSLEGTPYLRVPWTTLRSAIEGDLAVQATEVSGNLFGRAIVAVDYKAPVATVVDQPGLFLARDGSLFAAKGAVDLPLSVQPPAGNGVQNLSVFGSWRSVATARMCENIGERLPGRNWRIVVSREGSVELFPVQGAVVEFGSFEDMDEKVRVLVEALRDEPDLLASVRRLNLSPPSKAVRVP
jgi:hypothetical protein